MQHACHVIVKTMHCFGMAMHQLSISHTAIIAGFYTGFFPKGGKTIDGNTITACVARPD